MGFSLSYLNGVCYFFFPTFRQTLFFFLHSPHTPPSNGKKTVVLVIFPPLFSQERAAARTESRPLLKHDGRVLAGLLADQLRRAVHQRRLSLVLVALDANSDLLQAALVARNDDRDAELLLDGALDVAGVVHRARRDARVVEDREEVVAVLQVQRSVPVVDRALLAVVVSRRARAVLLELVADKVAALHRRPVVLELLLELSVGVEHVLHLLVGVVALAAGGIARLGIVRPQAVDGEVVRERLQCLRETAAAVVAKVARPRLYKPTQFFVKKELMVEKK